MDIRNEILTKFKGLTFIEMGHKYYLNGKEMECVSNVAHRFQEHLDTRKLATETYERNFNNPNSKYYGMTINEIENDKFEKALCENLEELKEIHEEMEKK